MKMRLVVALIGLAISFALPAFAQQTNTPDPQLRQVVDELAKKLDEAINNNDAAAAAALFTEDGVFVTPQGPINGRESIEKYYANLSQRVHYSNFINENDQNSPHVIGTAGNEVWSNGEWGATIQGQNGGPIQVKGYWSNITVREGDTWKKRMVTIKHNPSTGRACSDEIDLIKTRVRPLMRSVLQSLSLKKRELAAYR
jgi:ketosteroid isomerase-like protein